MNTDKHPTTSAIIAAAGSSQRMGGIDKVFATLSGRPVLARTVDTFQQCDAIDRIIVVVSQQNLEPARKLVAEAGWSKVTDVIPGGERRQDSVAAGLSKLQDCDWVVVHDGARPLVTIDLITRGLAEAKETGAAVAAVRVTDTIKLAGLDMLVQGTPPRQSLWSVQTPQVFRFDIISQAYRNVKFDVTDDSALVERMGHKVKLYAGAYDNIKITTPEDLALAEILWQKRGT